MPKLKYDIDAKQAMKAHNDLVKAIAKTGTEADKTEKKLTKQERAARRIEESIDPQKKYNRQIKETADLVNQNVLSMENAQRQAEKLRQRLENTGKAGREAFGAQAVGQLRGYVEGIVSIQAATGILSATLARQKADIEKTIQGSRQAAGGEASLVQLALAEGKTPQERAKLHESLLVESRSAFGAGAFENRDVAADATFALKSAGLDITDREFAYKVRRSGVFENVGDAATSYSSLNKAIGKEEVGSFDDFLDKAIKASALAPAQAPDIPLAAAKAGGSAKALGISDEFLFASTALLAGETGSASEGGTRLKAVLKGVEQAKAKNAKLFEGKSGIGIIKAIASLPEDQQGFGGILGGDSEAIAGFRTLRDNLPTLQTAVQEITTAQFENLAQQGVKIAQDDPSIQATILERQAANRLELSGLEKGRINQLFNTATDDQIRYYRENSSFATERELVSNAVDYVATWGGNVDSLPGLGNYKRDAAYERAEATGNQAVLDALEQQVEFSERIADGIERIAGDEPLTPVTQRAE